MAAGRGGITILEAISTISRVYHEDVDLLHPANVLIEYIEA